MTSADSSPGVAAVVTSFTGAHLVSDEDATCSVSGCSRANGGTLTLANRGGGFRVSACAEHGWRATQGDWFVFDVMGRKCALGGGETPPHFSPLRDDLATEPSPRSRRRRQTAALRLYDRLP